MQLGTIKSGTDGRPQFGIFNKGRFFSFTELAAEDELPAPKFTDISSYLAGSSVNHSLALQYKRLTERMPATAGLPVTEADFLPVLQHPAMLIDFALTPRHLANSAKTMIRHEFSGAKRLLAAYMMNKRVKKMQSSHDFSYYLGNHFAISGPADTLHWPSYSSYLDIEPELAIITGDTRQPIAGYTILNDVSARDVQMPELSALSLTRSKHFAKSNGLGAFFFVPDGPFDPLSLAVDVRIGNRYHWQGNTSEYSASPDDAVRYLQSVFDLRPGMIIGLGTIPGCCGLDNNQWIEPGDHISITFDSLGTLPQQFPQLPANLEPSRWTSRF